MNPNSERRFLDLISGRATGASASLLRGLLRTAEPFYAGATRVRNALFDKGIKKIRRLDRPVISIGNITTGGTGKTPMARWLADRLRDEGKAVAILSRGYRAEGNSAGDELMMLDRALNRPNARPVFLKADPDRFNGGRSLLRDHPEIDVFLLDDGFQHRRLHRDFDLVLISALEPFGYGHVLPRGLLREPLNGLKRADAIVITHSDQADERQLDAIKLKIRKYNPAAAFFDAIHSLVGLRSSDSDLAVTPIKQLSQQRFFAFCGIGDPSSFDRELQKFGPNYVGRRWFPDHQQYGAADLRELAQQARSAGADILLTTEKDWVKIDTFASDLPVWRVEMAIQFDKPLGEAMVTEIHWAMECPR